MYTKIYLTLGALLFLTAKGDPDPRTFITATPGSLFPSPSHQPQYEQNNVVVYLTPEQMTALQTGQGVLEPVIEPQLQSEDEQQNQQQLSQHELEPETDQKNDLLENRRLVITLNQGGKETESLKVPSQEEPQGLPWYSSVSGNKRYRTSNSGRNKYFASSQRQLENNRYYTPYERPEGRKNATIGIENPKKLGLKSYSYYKVYNETKGDNINIKIIHPNAKLREILEFNKQEVQKASSLNRKYEFVPYAYSNKKLSDVTPLEETNQRSLSSSKNSERQYAVLFSPAQADKKQEFQEELEDLSKTEQSEDEKFNDSQNQSTQNEQKQILDLLKKLNVQVETANVATRPVDRASQKVSITNQGTVPQSYIVHVPQPVEIKVRQPYSASFEIIRRVPIEIEDTENEAEKQTDKRKVENTVRVPAPKKIYVKVDKPILVDRIVSDEARRKVQVKPQKFKNPRTYFKIF